MKKTIVTLCAFAMFASLLIYLKGTKIDPSVRPGEIPTKEELSVTEQRFINDFEKFQQKVEEALAWRASAIREAEILRLKAHSSTPLGPDDLTYLHRGADQYVSLRKELLSLAYKHRNLVDGKHQLNWAPGLGTKAEKAMLIVDPTDPMGDLLIKQFKLALAAGLVLYDNFLVAIWPYHQDGKLRRLINYDNKRILNGLKKLSDNYLSQSNRATIHKSVIYFDVEYEWRTGQDSKDDVHSYLDQLILASPTYRYAKKKSWVKTITRKLSFSAQGYMDALSVFKEESLNIASGIFGNVVGLIETRKGKLKKLAKGTISKIKGNLKPLDILLEKTPFRLTDKLIPGHFGHVAIWLGTEKDLREANLWDSPFIIPYHEKIRSGHHIIEALRQGVVMSTLEHFLNVDDFVVLRLKTRPKSYFYNYVEKAIQQIGKEYDFNFDIETDKKIVCSELVYVVFPDLPWPIEKKVGRYTISPDNIVEFALARRSMFDIPIFYYDGSPLNSRRWQALELVTQAKYSKLAPLLEN